LPKHRVLAHCVGKYIALALKRLAWKHVVVRDTLFFVFKRGVKVSDESRIMGGLILGINMLLSISSKIKLKSHQRKKPKVGRKHCKEGFVKKN
jgi:hypothetical protein